MKITKSKLKQIIKEEVEAARLVPDSPWHAAMKLLQNPDIRWSGQKVYNVLSDIFQALGNREEAWKITADLLATADWSATDPID